MRVQPWRPTCICFYDYLLSWLILLFLSYSTPLFPLLPPPSTCSSYSSSLFSWEGYCRLGTTDGVSCQDGLGLLSSEQMIVRRKAERGRRGKNRIRRWKLRCCVLRGVAWCCVVLRGTARCCVVLRGAAWCCVVLRGAAWCCVVLRGAAWCWAEKERKKITKEWHTKKSCVHSSLLTNYIHSFMHRPPIYLLVLWMQLPFRSRVHIWSDHRNQPMLCARGHAYTEHSLEYSVGVVSFYWNTSHCSCCTALLYSQQTSISFYRCFINLKVSGYLSSKHISQTTSSPNPTAPVGPDPRCESILKTARHKWAYTTQSTPLHLLYHIIIHWPPSDQIPGVKAFWRLHDISETP